MSNLIATNEKLKNRKKLIQNELKKIKWSNLWYRIKNCNLTGSAGFVISYVKKTT